MLYVMSRFVLKPLFWLFFRPRITGRENVPATGAVILASNHLSFIDSIVIPLVSPRKVAMLAKAEYWRGKGVKGWWTRTLFSSLGAQPVERGEHRAAQAALDTALAVLKLGDAFAIYPEGTRSRDGRLARGKTGVAWLALTADCPIVPVAVQGTNRIMPIGSRALRPHRASVSFGRPLHFPQYAGQAARGKPRREVTDAVMTEIATLSGQDKADWGSTGS
ncbi:MAG: 1-acyl-sn-glycerol-3-phosphate acyltransferase [Geodermatophilaceae bacterium]|nr:1-acyl-sn-glycerol-3-phosphate acyltransferase [Geodermatophilaceae bacterium]